MKNLSFKLRLKRMMASLLSAAMVMTSINMPMTAYAASDEMIMEEALSEETFEDFVTEGAEECQDNEGESRNVTVSIYSENDLSGLSVLAWDSIKPYVSGSEVTKVEGKDNWYTFSISMLDGVKDVAADKWPGLQIDNSSWNSPNSFKLSPSDHASVYEAIVMNAADGDELFIKNWEFYASIDEAEGESGEVKERNIYFFYDPTAIEDGQYLGVSPWSADNVTSSAAAETVDYGGWSGKCYVLDNEYAGWWKLPVSAVTGGYDLYLVGSDNKSVAKLNGYDDQWNNKEIYAQMSDKANEIIAVKADKSYLGEAAEAITHQVTMYVYDESGNTPALYIWANGGEWDDASYPLQKFDEEAGAVSDITPDKANAGDNFYDMTADETLGENWYSFTFILNNELTGKMFQLVRRGESDYIWEPNTKFAYDGSADADASVVLTEGKVYYKDGAFRASLDTTLLQLRDIITEAKGYTAEDYTEESFKALGEAIAAADETVAKYSDVSAEDAAATTGEDINTAYDAVKAAIDALEKPFKAGKTVHVYYYSDSDITDLTIKPWDVIKPYMQEAEITAVGKDRENWYTFDLVMSDGIETITDEGDAWPGFQATNADWNAANGFTIARGALYEIYKAIVIDSKDGESYYIRDDQVHSSFDGADLITLDMLKTLLDSCAYYKADDYSEESFAALSSAMVSANEIIANEVSEKTAEGAELIKTVYNALSAAIDGLVPGTVADINVKQVILNDDFITGADISSFVSIRQSGVVFKADTDGDGINEALNDQQFFDYLKAGGTNWARIRVWNDPYDSSGNGYGGGNNDIDKAIILGKLAQKAGMKILIDFHYSDFWADPSKYKSPKAWADFSNQEKADALYDFTYDCMKKLYDAGVTDVYMVQVGNESNHGVAGETDGDATILYGYGCEAVHDAADKLFGHNIDAAVHFTDVQNGGGTVTGCLDRQLRKCKYKSHADGTLQYVPYDAIGVSYYPMYNHGSISNLKSVLKSLSSSYGPGGSSTRVFVAETSWATTWEDGDGFSNSGPSISGGQDVTSYSISVQGQADELRAVVDTVNSINDGIDDLTGFGVFYWEAAWLSPYQACYDDYSFDSELFAKNKEAWEKYGSGWASKYSVEYDPTDAGLYYGGVGVDNMAWFAFDGTALPTAQAYKLIRKGATTGAASRVVAVEANQKIVLNLGDDLILPDTLVSYLNDGSTGEVAVTWNKEDIEAVDTDIANIYIVYGKAVSDGKIYPARITVEVVDNNTIAALKNHDFESIQDATNNNVKFSYWDVYGVNEDGTYVTYLSDETKGDDNKYFNWGTNNITINNENAKGNTATGRALNFWHGDKPMEIHIYQKIGTAKKGTEFIPGEYTFGGYLEGGSAGEYDKQYAAAYVYDSEEDFEADIKAAKEDPVKHPIGTNAKRYKSSTQFAGWLSWQNAAVTGVKVNEGQYLVVGFEMNGSTAGAWGSVDDTYLYGTFNVNIGANTGSGKGAVTASKYIAGTAERVKITARPEKKSTGVAVLNTITVSGDGINSTYFKESDGWVISGNKAIYTAKEADKAATATTVKFNMPESDVTVYADFVNQFSAGAVDIASKDIVVKLDGKEIGAVKYYASGKSAKPAVSLVYNGYELTASDYSVKYGKNSSAGEGTITVTAKGSRFTGTRTITFPILAEARKKIASVEFKNPDVAGKVPGYYYTGSEITFNAEDIIVKDADGKTVSANDYVLGYEKNIKVGNATLYVSPSYNSAYYTGNVVKKFKVARADISKLIVPGNANSRMVVNKNNTVADTSYVKDGAMPSVSIYYNGTINLRKGKDYKVSYTNNKKVTAGNRKAGLTIVGRGNYTGKVTFEYNVSAKDIADKDIITHVEDIAEGALLVPRVGLSLSSAPKKRLSPGNFTVKVYEIPQGLATISENNLGKEVTRQFAKAGEYGVKIEGKLNLKGYVLTKLRVVDKQHLVTTGSVRVGKVFYQGAAIRIDGGTLLVDASAGRAVSDNGIKVMTAAGGTVLRADQFEVYRYYNNYSSGTAKIYLRVKDGVVGADGKPLAGDVVKKFRIKQLKLVSLDRYNNLVKEGKAMGYAAINHKSAATAAEVTVSTNLYDVMTEDSTYKREQYYTGYAIKPTYIGNSVSESGIRIYMNGSKNTRTFTQGKDYTLTHRNNIKAAIVAKNGNGIPYGGENIQDKVQLSYVKGSGATAVFAGLGNFMGRVTFADAFYIHPRTIDQLDMSVESAEFGTGKTRTELKFMDPLYGVRVYLKKGIAYSLKQKNTKKVSSAGAVNAPEVYFVAKNNLKGEGKNDVQKLNFAISAGKITPACVKTIKPAAYKDGKAIEPVVKVAVKGKRLTLGKDYIIEYTNNYQRCGSLTADGKEYENAPTVKITGIGNYTGEVVKAFVIK